MIELLVRYLSGTSDYGIYLPKGNGTLYVEAYFDADWGRDPDHRRSRSEFIISMNGGPVMWRSKLQTATAQSTSEAKFAALAFAALAMTTSKVR